MPIIIHASRDFIKRYKCELSLPGERVLQAGRLDSWSVHFYRISRSPMVMMMNDATLWTVLIPAKGITTLQAILTALLDRIAKTWASHGAVFDPSNQSVLFFPRSNRRLIGSMNDAVTATHFFFRRASDRGQPVNWNDAENRLNDTPYKVLEYDRPKEMLAKMLTGN
jgi:hypothetical protein